MGEGPAFFVDDPQGNFLNGFDLKLKCKGWQTATIVGNKTYVIGGAEDESAPRVGVRILDKSTGQWVIPTVLGTEPRLVKDHSVLLLSDDRILVVQGSSSSDDCFWFLEVDTPFVRKQKQNFGREVVAWTKGIIGNTEKPIVISGPSGVGKGTLITKLMKEFPSMFGFSVSHTTRSPRDKEKDGIHYHFTERGVMEKEIKDGKFLEFASVHGNLYGTSIEAVEAVADTGKRCILDIDVQGARSVRASSLEAIFIFIRPPSFEELEKRLRARGTETQEQIQKRLQNSKAELERGKAPGLFDHILVNDDLDECYRCLKDLLGLNGGVLTACKSAPKKVADVAMDHSLSKIGQKILISWGAATPEKPSKNLSVLDLTCLKGGAPGRTRGLNIYTMDSFNDDINVVKELS